MSNTLASQASMSSRSIRAACVVATCLAIGACSHRDPHQGLGLAGLRASEGKLQILIPSCFARGIVSLELDDARSKAPIWAIATVGTFAHPSEEHAFTVGRAPHGFVTIVSLRSQRLLPGAYDLTYTGTSSLTGHDSSTRLKTLSFTYLGANGSTSYAAPRCS